MKRLLILLISILFFSCTKKEVKIPTLSEKGIQEIYNHSQVWMFFEVEENDTLANINRKNTISTTHWLFNIDKRLPLKTIIPSIKKLKYKHSNSLHSEEGMHNYFSYSDTISKKLSFLEFDEVEYMQDSIISKNYIKKNSDTFLSYNNISLTFNPNSVWIDDAKIEKNEFKETLLEFIDFSSENNKTMLHLNFNQNILYQDYLYYKTLINSISNNSIATNNIEFIFDKNKVPDCGCE